VLCHIGRSLAFIPAELQVLLIPDHVQSPTIRKFRIGVK
jgi:hypothetical protein